MTDFLLDDFILFEDFGEAGKTYLNGEHTIGTNDYVDLMDSNYITNQYNFGLEMTNLSDENKIIERDKECFSTVNCSNKNSICSEDQLENKNCSSDKHSGSCENTLLESSVAEESITSSMLNTSKNEKFCDLTTFLEKEGIVFPSTDKNTSNNSNSIKPPSVNEMCFSTTFSRKQCEDIYIIPESNIDSDESFEPNRKLPRLDKCKSKCKDKKYVEMRCKNNFASRRSRQTKKQKEKEMEEKAITLEKENEALRIKEKKLQELVDELKQMLFSSVKKK